MKLIGRFSNSKLWETERNDKNGTKNLAKENNSRKRWFCNAKILTLISVALSLLGYTAWEHYPFDEETSKIFFIAQGNSRFLNCCSICSPITCTDIDFGKDIDDFIFYMRNGSNAQEVCLKLESPKFPNSTIYSNWLPADVSSKIKDLTIANSKLRTLQNNSFRGFTNLRTLTFENTNLTSLRKAAFNSLVIEVLNLRENKMLYWVEKGLLEGLPLTTLQVQCFQCRTNNCSQEAAQFFSNLTGISMPALQLLDLSFNDFPNFTATILGDLPQLTIINLAYNGLQTFEKGSFDRIKRSCGEIYLTNNDIQGIPEEVFGGLLNHNWSVHVDKNELVCNCEMLWLQNFVLNQNAAKNYEGSRPPTNSKGLGDFDKVTCSDPPENAGVPFLEAEMCPGELTTEENRTSDTTVEEQTSSTHASEGSKSTTARTLPSPPPSLPPDDPPDSNYTDNTFEFNCSKSIITPIRPYNFKTSESRTIKLEKRHDFKIVDHDETSVTLDFDGADGLEKTLFWIADYQVSSKELIKFNKTNCGITKNSRYTITDLSSEQSYMFCAVDDAKGSINVLDCLPHKTAPAKENRTWLTEGDKFKYISIIVLVILLAFSVGAIILFFLVRENPALIRGSKRVIIVQRKGRSDVMVMPKGYKNLSKPKNLPEENTDASDTYSVVSYISAREPTTQEILTYNLGQLQNKKGERMDGNKQPIPPPYSKTVQDSRGLYKNHSLDFDYM